LYGERLFVSTCERDAGDHVGWTDRLDHDERMPINHAVEDSSRRVVAAIFREDDLPLQGRLEFSTNGTCDPGSV
jgi:hypothetical protein